MENFREGISGTASITKSTLARESIDVVGLRRDRILSDSSCVILSFETSFAKSLSGIQKIVSASPFTMGGECCQMVSTCELEALINRGLVGIHKCH